MRCRRAYRRLLCARGCGKEGTDARVVRRGLQISRFLGRYDRKRCDVTVINEDVKPRNDEFEFGAPRTTRRDARDPRIAEVKRKIEVTYKTLVTQ